MGRYLVAILTAALVGCVRHYPAEGVILGVDRAARTVTVSHRAIPHYMDAMAMTFPAAKSVDLEPLAPGARIRFRLDVGSHGASIHRVELEQGALADVPIPDAPVKPRAGQPAPDISLVDQSGQRVRLADFRGRVAAIDFIYTRCPMPDVCPRLSANFAYLERRFGARLTLFSITIDPQHDTPEVLAEYARRWKAGADWHFLTGTQEEIREVAAHFGLVYWPEDGVITHTSMTAIVAGDGKLAATVEGSSFTARQLADLVASALGARP